MSQGPALTSFLLLGAALFCIGVYGVLTRRNAVAILMAIELMLNAANINLVAFSRVRGFRARAGAQLRGLRDRRRRGRGGGGAGDRALHLPELQEHQR